jgi:YbbR domain-containing protein
MSWLTEDWRLKLLALGLAVVMLGAVAFSQNPPTIKTLSVPLNYRLPPNPGIIITNGPSRIPVTITGLADVIGPLTADNVTAFADATHAAPGPAVKLNVTAQAPGVNVQPPPPIAVNIDQLKTVEVPVTVNTHAAPGWTVDKATPLCPPNPAPCHVHFSGPASWETGITAVVNYTPPVNFSTQDSQNWPIVLTSSSGPINLSQPTDPQLSLDFYTVAIHIEAHNGSTFSTVYLVAPPPSQPPPPQYHIAGVTISPATVIISGDPAILSKIQFITLPAIDLSAARSTQKVTVTIPYPDNVSGSAATATVTYTIQPNPSPSPSP